MIYHLHIHVLERIAYIYFSKKNSNVLLSLKGILYSNSWGKNDIAKNPAKNLQNKNFQNINAFVMYLISTIVECNFTIIMHIRPYKVNFLVLRPARM